jgi:hypothetical protein
MKLPSAIHYGQCRGLHKRLSSVLMYAEHLLVPWNIVLLCRRIVPGNHLLYALSPESASTPDAQGREARHQRQWEQGQWMCCGLVLQAIVQPCLGVLTAGLPHGFYLSLRMQIKERNPYETSNLLYRRWRKSRFSVGGNLGARCLRLCFPRRVRATVQFWSPMPTILRNDVLPGLATLDSRSVVVPTGLWLSTRMSLEQVRKMCCDPSPVGIMCEAAHGTRHH